MPRAEFGIKVRNAAWDRCNGLCEHCGSKLHIGRYHFDHIMPDGLGGKPTLDNCQVLCVGCHHEKTTKEDRPKMDKADRIRKKHLGIWKSDTPMRKSGDPWGRNKKSNTRDINEDVTP